jgi:hypothetical protein
MTESRSENDEEAILHHTQSVCEVWLAKDSSLPHPRFRMHGVGEGMLEAFKEHMGVFGEDFPCGRRNAARRVFRSQGRKENQFFTRRVPLVGGRRYQEMGDRREFQGPVREIRSGGRSHHQLSRGSNSGVK